MSIAGIKLKLLFFVVVLWLAVMPAAAHAQNAQPAKPLQGITISPAYQQSSVSEGESERAVSFTITNNRPVQQDFKLSVADFNTLGETGGLFFVGANPTQLQKKYGLAKWFKLSQDKITLGAKQSAKIEAQILNLPDMSPGGHYGALMITANSVESGNDVNKVALNPIASSLLFVTKLGGDTHKLSLSDVQVSRSLFKLPDSITLRFHNAGNTHLIPRGIVTVSDAQGNIVSKGIINDSSSIILPETNRKIFVPLNTVKHSSKPGQYKLKVDFRFDGIDQYRSYKQSVYYIIQIIM
jgi:hypothetical protein